MSSTIHIFFSHTEWYLLFSLKVLMRWYLLRQRFSCQKRTKVIKLIILFLQDKSRSVILPAHLLALMTEVYNEYLQQKLADVAEGQRRTKSSSFSGVPLENITRVSDNQYLVRSVSSAAECDVDMLLAYCSCPVGTYDLCKHQMACSEHFSFISLPQIFENTAYAKQQLVRLAFVENFIPLHPDVKENW